jgi:hypothetical protein
MLVKILALFYITFIILIVQYPETFSHIFNMPIGKALVLILLLLLTNYNIYAGLICTLIVIIFYGILNLKGIVCEKFDNKLLTPLPLVDESEISLIDREHNIKSKNSNSIPVVKINNDNPEPFDNIYK